MRQKRLEISQRCPYKYPLVWLKLWLAIWQVFYVGHGHLEIKIE